MSYLLIRITIDVDYIMFVSQYRALLLSVECTYDFFFRGENDPLFKVLELFSDECLLSLIPCIFFKGQVIDVLYCDRYVYLKCFPPYPAFDWTGTTNNLATKRI